MKTIGFIGVGIMGKPMVRNLMKAGFTLHVFARSQEKVADVVEEGASFHETIASLTKAVDVLITMVGFVKDVEEVYFGTDNIFDNVRAGQFLIDMTTTAPALEVRIASAAKEKGARFLDAPVTGGDVGAVKGTLSVLVGGEKEDYEACQNVFAAVGKNINYFGPAGSGQHAKMANQIAVACTLAGVTEAFAYAKKAGLDLQTLYDAISGGAASSMQMTTNGAKMLAHDFSPGFRLKHLVKDMRIAKAEADERALALPALFETLRACLTLEEEGYGDDGTQVLIRHYLNDF